jgi:flagellar hook protein FlgE
MGFLDAFSATSGLRQLAAAASSSVPDAFRDMEPELDFPWDADTVEDDPIEHAPIPAPRQSFLVCEQSGTTGRGEPIFGRAFASHDDELALSEDGYVINDAGQFLLGIVLDGKAKPAVETPQVMRLDMSGIPTTGTSRIGYRANLPSYPMTAYADYDIDGSELLDTMNFARDPSAHGSGVVLGDDRLKFLDRSLAGGSIGIIAPDGSKLKLVMRWAKMTSLRSAGRDSWNLFYRVRKDARSGEVAWKNAGHRFVFGSDGRLEDGGLAVPIMDMMIDGARLGNLSLIFGPGGLTQFADRSGLVKTMETDADGCIGGAFTGLSLSGRGRLFAHYANGEMLALADIRFTGEEDWFASRFEVPHDSARNAVAYAA